MSYFYGQRVITGCDIAVVIRPPRGNERDLHDDSKVWVRLSDGVEQWRAAHNVTPLPHGQL